MAILACDLNSLNKNSSCFQCLSQLQKQAALVYLMEQRLAVLSGAKARNVNTLSTAVAGFRAAPIDPVCDEFDVAVAQEGAIISGVPGAATQTITQLKVALNPFANTSLSQLRAMEIAIRCALQSF